MNKFFVFLAFLIGAGIVGGACGFIASYEYFDYRHSHIPPVSDTDMRFALNGGHILYDDTLVAEAESPIEHRCDSTGHGLARYSQGYIVQNKNRDTVYIHDTVYLAAPTPNQPTYIK